MLLVDHPDGKVARRPARARLDLGPARAGWGNERFGALEPSWEVCLAAEQHDIPWLEWERAPAIDPKTGYPHTFMSLDMPTKLAMWATGPDLLLAQSRYAALLVSLHGSHLYRELDRSAFEKDIRATLEATDDDEIDRNRRLIWAWDSMSLALLLGWRPWTAEGVPSAAARSTSSSQRMEPSARGRSPRSASRSTARAGCSGRRARRSTMRRGST